MSSSCARVSACEGEGVPVTVSGSRRRFSVPVVVGVLLLLVAVACFGWAGWKVWGTSVAANASADVARDQLRDAFGDSSGDGARVDDEAIGPDVTEDLTGGDDGGSPVSSSGSTDESAAALPAPDAGGVPDGVDVSVDGQTFRGVGLLTAKAAGIVSLPVLAGAGDNVLDRGVAGQYRGTAAPGQVGNFAVAGHRVSHGAVFNDVDRLRVGNVVVVRAKSGTYTYRVTRKVTVRPDDSRALAPVPMHPGVVPTRASMVLTTCTPKVSTKYRLVVIAQRVL